MVQECKALLHANLRVAFCHANFQLETDAIKFNVSDSLIDSNLQGNEENREGLEDVETLNLRNLVFQVGPGLASLVENAAMTAWKDVENVDLPQTQRNIVEQNTLEDFPLTLIGILFHVFVACPS